MSLFQAIILLAGVATLSACASIERGTESMHPVSAEAAAAPVVAPVVQPVKVVAPVEPASFTVHFDFAQDEIKASAMQILHGAAKVAKRNNPGMVRIRGFTDASGKRDFNLKLAQRRAEAVADQFRKLGITAQIEIAEAEIIVAEPGRAKKDPANRKVEITFEDFAVIAGDHAPSADPIEIVAADAPEGGAKPAIAAKADAAGPHEPAIPISYHLAWVAGEGVQSRGRLGLDKTYHAP